MLNDGSKERERPNNVAINPFLAKAPILYSLKTPENQRFSGVFRGHKMKTLAKNGLMKVTCVLKYNCGKNEMIGNRYMAN